MAGRERLLDPTGDSDRTADTTLSLPGCAASAN